MCDDSLQVDASSVRFIYLATLRLRFSHQPSPHSAKHSLQRNPGVRFQLKLFKWALKAYGYSCGSNFQANSGGLTPDSAWMSRKGKVVPLAVARLGKIAPPEIGGRSNRCLKIGESHGFLVNGAYSIQSAGNPVTEIPLAAGPLPPSTAFSRIFQVSYVLLSSVPWVADVDACGSLISRCILPTRTHSWDYSGGYLAGAMLCSNPSDAYRPCKVIISLQRARCVEHVKFHCARTTHVFSLIGAKDMFCPILSIRMVSYSFQ